VVGWGACPTVEELRLDSLEVGKSESPSIMGSQSSQSSEWGAVSLVGTRIGSCEEMNRQMNRTTKCAPKSWRSRSGQNCMAILRSDDSPI
jgi:hypothetical protein